MKWGHHGTYLSFTHSQSNTSLCNDAQEDEPTLNYTVEWVHLSGVDAVGVVLFGFVCVYEGSLLRSMCVRENNVCAIACASKCV